MIILNREDYFEIHLNSMLSNYDRDTISLLYQPIIGSNAAMLYFTLWSLQKLQKTVDIFSVQNHLLSMSGFNLDQIQEGRNKLEGVGLIQTFFKQEDNKQLFIFELFAPKTPADFFDDYLFKGLLIEKIGPKFAQKLASIFKSKDIDKNGFDNISCTFGDAFSNFGSNLDAYNYDLKTKEKTFGRITKDITDEFDYGAFLNQLKVEYHILGDKINEQTALEIKRIAILYGVKEIDMAYYISSSYRPEDETSIIDFNKLIKLVESDKKLMTLRNEDNKIEYDFDSKIGDKINLLSTTSSYDYLKIKEGYKNPPPAHIAVINELSSMGLSSGVINVIIDYCLTIKNGVLSKNYCTAIGGSMNTKNINSVLDALNYLSQNRSKKSLSNTKSSKEENIQGFEEAKSQELNEDLKEFYESLED